ncbi:MAG: adenylate/guanylate cyclase domain-containing protein [Bacillota bacterium]|nr:adenylate/guanylate cyclase domain-containing protein [Bacillota bacterium]
MSTGRALKAEVEAIFATKWKRRQGRVVPDVDAITLSNDSVTLDAAVLYADLADSTGLVDGFKDWFAAEVYKAFLIAACRIIRVNGGEITAFDGDRVMAVFLGDKKNSRAAQSGLTINWAVQNIINPAIKVSYPDTGFQVKHSVGIDTSTLLVAKTGIRASNDLVWVGRAANYAAKLSTLREDGYPTFISEAVFKKLSDGAKYGGEPRRPMWERRTWSQLGMVVYRSSWYWEMP